MSLLAELNRRKVFRVGAAYLVVGWLVIQVAATVLPQFQVPEWAPRLVTLLVALGLPIALVMAWMFDVTPEGIRVDASRTGNRRVFAVAAVLAALALGWFFLRAPEEEKGPGSFSGPTVDASGRGSAPENDPGPFSIAVLPFANLSDEKANAFFASGIQDEILTKLAKIGSLRVLSRTSTQRYASAPENLTEIARQLGVANILEGSVQRSGNAVHINVQLIRAANEEHLWAESYNRTLDDVFGVQGEVAQAVADALRATLTGAERQLVAAKGTENPKAFEAYLRGRAADRSGYSNMQLVGAIDNYYAAVREDPAFAQAWAALAVAMSGLHQNGYDVERSTASAVREAADAAMKLQPELAESLLAKGAYVYRIERDYPAAIELYKRALAKQPGDVDILAELFFVERRSGRWDDAIAHYQEAIARDPRNVSVIVQGACEIHYWLRRYDEARELLQRALAIAPEDTTAPSCLAQIELRLGRLDAAEAWLARVPAESRDYYERLAHIDSLTYRRRDEALAALMQSSLQREDAALTNVDLIGMIRLAYAQRRSGNEAIARRSFERLARAIGSRPGGIDHVMAAAPVTPLVYAGLGDHAKAIAAARDRIEVDRNDTLELASSKTVLAQVHAQHGDRDAAIALLPELLTMPCGITPAMLVLDPMWDPIRDDPRFIALTKQPISEYVPDQGR